MFISCLIVSYLEVIRSHIFSLVLGKGKLHCGVDPSTGVEAV